jgi:hypothetical protein
MLSEPDELPSITMGDFVLRIELDDLTPFTEEVAAKELRENPENRDNGIRELRQLLKQGKRFMEIVFKKSSSSLLLLSKSFTQELHLLFAQQKVFIFLFVKSNRMQESVMFSNISTIIISASDWWLVISHP